MDDNVFGVSETIEPDEDNSVETEQESTVETEETESAPEGQAEQTETQTEPETKLILGKFKSQEDLAKAYQNLEKYATKLSQQKPAPAKEEQPAEEAQLMAWYEQTVQTNPAQANAVLAQYMAKKQIDQYKAEFESQLQPIREERQLQHTFKSLSEKYPDIAQYAKGMEAEVLEMADDQDSLKDPRLYEIAYFRAKTKAMEEQSKTAFENGQRKAAETLKQKKKIVNEISKANNEEEDTLPPGITITGAGDGIFF